MKTRDEFMDELRNHRYAMQSLVVKMQGIAHQIDDLADLLKDEDTSARELVDTAPFVEPQAKNRIGEKHFRFLAVLNEYGPMKRAHVAKLVGISEGSLDFYASTIRKHHLGDLRSRKGVYTLHALGDGVADSREFKLV